MRDVPPPEERAARHRKLADDLRADPAANGRLRRPRAQAFAPRPYGDAGIPEATTPVRESIACVA